MKKEEPVTAAPETFLSPSYPLLPCQDTPEASAGMHISQSLWISEVTYLGL